VELEGKQPIINTLLNPAHHMKGICENERICLEVRRMSVRGYGWILVHDEPHKAHGCMTAQQECVRVRAGKDRVCISYTEMI